VRRAHAGDTNAPSTELLRATLARLLSRYYGRSLVIEALVRAPSPYRSSFALEDLNVHLDDGTALALVFKDVGWPGLPPEFRGGKPRFLYRATREIAVYTRVLQHAPLGTARCYGALGDRRQGRYWLFLERVPGVPLYAIGDFDTWRAVARWLAGMHAQFAADAARPLRARGVPLVRYDAAYYRRWIRRARPALVAAAHARSNDGAHRIDGLLDRYDQVIARLVALPATLLHGEFYASNILAQATAGTLRVCPVDWEMAGIGPGLIDLAALIAGSWTETQKIILADAYFDERRRLTGTRELRDTFLGALACCRLHVALQWLGWSPGYAPPPEHVQDWEGEARALAAMLGL
jgi:aminoglycoside phosphotransferase (APT) family kinase protein